MTVGDKKGNVLSAKTVTSWGYIEDQALFCLRGCISSRQGGVILINGRSATSSSKGRRLTKQDDRGTGVSAFYIYAVGSPFESLLNQYMIDEKPIWPGLFSPTSFDSKAANRTLLNVVNPNAIS